MNEIMHLANQHILEWESRLQHIDEMAARAHELHGKAPEGSEEHKKLANLRTYREQLSRDLDEGGAHSALEATGQQLEDILGSILGIDTPRRRKLDQTE
jgi:hypothetical protein